MPKKPRVKIIKANLMKLKDLLITLNALDLPVLVIGQNRSITAANTSAESLFGKNLAGSDFVFACRHPGALSCIDKVLSGEDKAETEFTLTLPVRTTYKVQACRLDDVDEIDAKVLFSMYDISHVIEAEQMRVDFIANVSHELRSPLTALSGFIETLKGAARDDPAARERFLDIMQGEADRMTRLIDDLLSLSKVEVNEHVRPDQKIDLTMLVERIAATLTPQARSKKKLIKLEKPETPLNVPGETDQLTQVFQNLIENATKYGNNDSEITISLSRVDQIPGRKMPGIAVAITDHSEGIAPEHIPRLTERFYRVDKGRSREMGGTGLGLAIVKHIVNRHRGRLVIKSTIGQGSTFTVYLPLG